MLSSRHAQKLRRLALAAFALGLTACAAAAQSGSPAPMAPPPTAAAPSAESADPGSDLDRAEADLNRALGGRRSTADKKKEAAPNAGTRPKDEGGAPKQDHEEGADGDACGVACNALGSMDRSAQHLCDLTGSGEPRCQSARDRVDRARQRVSAECGGC